MVRISRLVAAGIAVVGSACSAATTPGDGNANPPSVAIVTISPPSVSTQVGKSVQLSAAAKDSAGNVLSGRSVSWISSDSTIAQVSSSGMVSARTAGSAVVQATVEGKHASVTATVAPVPVASLVLSPLGTTVMRGATVQYSATAKDAAGNVLSGRLVLWSSSNTAVATIASSGLATTLTTGSTNIGAVSEGVTAQTSLTVTATPPPPVASVAVSLASSNLNVGQTTQASATLKDVGGNVLTGRAITWSSSNTAVATVNANGVVTGAGAGSANIIATSEGVTGQASVSVTVVPVASVTVSLASSSLTTGKTTQATAVTKDAGGNVLSGRAVTWSSSNTAVATVNASGVVTAVAAGSANVIATSEGVTGQASLSVTVVPVASVTVSLGSSSLTIGQTTQATAVTKDASGNVLTGRTITWSSGNAGIASVSGSGVVTAVALGSTTIAATSEGKSGGANVSVSAVTTTVDTLFFDNFESGALADANRWQDIVGTGASIASAATEGIGAVSGSHILKLSGEGAAISHFVSTAATSPYEHLYLSFRMLRTSQYQATNPGLRAGGIRGSTTQWGSYGVGYNTTGSCPDDPNNVHQQEFMFAYAFNDPAAFALRTYTNWIGEVKFSQNPPMCGGNYALDAASNPPATYYDLNFVPTVDTWHQYEVEIQLNDVGVANGWQRMWVDGVLKIAHLNVRYRTTSGMKLWAITIDTGTMHGGSLYFDDVVVTTGRAP
ncbi:MAG TPA: Ig-like domain-containing protein [Gemmatimonadaceae bacterium]|nr:Ig-like domain-containing protein [Gemmatimonadaceae bacterium]